MKKTLILLSISILSFSQTSSAQIEIDENAMGAWYMYFFNTTINESSWGVQGDIQFRNWDMGGDLEQLLLRGGLTYKPQNADVLLTLGYGNITTGTYGEPTETKAESRIYQEALFPVNFGERLYTKHRFRYEQRFVGNQDFRTRYRYNLFVNVPLNKSSFEKNTIYLAFYNELFINGQRDIGNENTVEIFDRNRFYSALGYVIKKGLNVQLGVMQQSTNNWTKSQIQLSIHHKI
jgi:hypothetical protein